MPASPLILAIGDSLVAGYGLSTADGFSAQLERRLRVATPNAQVINAGRSGDTTGDALRRLPGVMSALSSRPDLTIVQVGPNDMLRGVSPAATRANLDAVLVELNRCGFPVLLTTVEPPAMLRDRARAYLGIHAELAARHVVVTCPFFPPGVLGHADMVLADRVHPNARAIGRVVDALAPTVQRMLDGGAGMALTG